MEQQEKTEILTALKGLLPLARKAAAQSHFPGSSFPEIAAAEAIIAAAEADDPFGIGDLCPDCGGGLERHYTRYDTMGRLMPADSYGRLPQRVDQVRCPSCDWARWLE